MSQARDALKNKTGGPLPDTMRTYFWDCDFKELRWPADAGFVLPRLLRSGGWDAVRWLRSQGGDRMIERWLRAHRGRGMSPERLRFWELILELPRDEVDEWIASSARSPWRTRTG